MQTLKEIQLLLTAIVKEEFSSA